MKYLIKSTGDTNPGMVRTNNEDRFGILETKNHETVFFVADGMGGHSAGEVASGHMAETIEHFFSDKQSLEDTWGSANHGSPIFFSNDYLTRVVEKGNAKIYHQAMDEQDKKGMGTTLTLSIIQNNQLKIAQVGDSRAYLVRNKTIRLLTRDHSLVQNEVDQGLLTPEEALWDPRKNIITKAVGIVSKVEPDIYDYTLQPKDRVLLCSDGLYDLVPEKQLLHLSKKKTIEESVQQLINTANASGGKDNVTVVMVEIDLDKKVKQKEKQQDKKPRQFWFFSTRKKEEKA